jgi:GT2 family glycosyltransferase
MALMRVSVVVPTYRRPDALMRCLDALARQDTAADEILVVVRHQDEASRQCVRELQNDSIRLVLVDIPAGRPGFVAALNAGIAASSGDVVCLTDDDAEPRADWVSLILATFAQDPMIGAVGGRDWTYQGTHLEDGEESVVGTVSWWGRIIGRHHLGVGPPREVAILKGVNLSVRGDLIRQVGFDTRLRGTATEHHSELGLCLKLLRMGFRIIYDPAIAVDHRREPRVAEAREFGPHQVRDAAYNETLALLEHLPPAGQTAHLLWTTAIGIRGVPGLAQSARLLLITGDPKLRLLLGNFTGRGLAVLTYLRPAGRRVRAGRRVWPSGRSGDTPGVLAVAHSPSAGVRAEQLLEKIPGSHIVKPSAEARGMASLAWLVLRSRAKVLYLVDVGKTTAPAAVLGRLTGKRVIVDTGDATFALARSLGDRTRLGLLLVGVGEQFTLRSAHEIIVRGRTHAARVPRPSTHIPDLAPRGAAPAEASKLRVALDLQGAYVAGVVGSLIFSPRLRISYGWDLIEALPHIHPSVVALIVGDGSGLEPLRQRAITLGVIDRCRFVGRVPTDRACEYVSAMDVALSTQTNDVVGQVRTTGKLPLYLACGSPVLASHVGEAALILGPVGWTLPYYGVLDYLYPSRLGAAIEAWRTDPNGAAIRRQTALRIAREFFDEEEMRQKLASTIHRVTNQR